MTYPVDLRLEAPHEVARWRPLVHWLLAIPHLFVLGILQYAASALAVVSWVIILVTGSLPLGIARFQVMVLRYQTRVYSYAYWLREPYPAFAFDMEIEDPQTDPVRVDVAVQLEGRNRLTVALRFLWIIPAALFGAVVVFGLAAILFVSFFVVIVTGRWQEGLRKFVIDATRLLLQISAYWYLLVDDYPPFALGPASGPDAPSPTAA
jgi:hypothetical protein